MSQSTPTTVGIQIPSTAPQDLIDRVAAFMNDLRHVAGIDDVTLNVVRTCRVCGCTDARACFGGCAWVGPADDLCTACAPTAVSLDG